MKMRGTYKHAAPGVREMLYDKVELCRLAAVGKSPLVVCSWCHEGFKKRYQVTVSAFKTKIEPSGSD